MHSGGQGLACDLGLLVEDVLDLPERVGREDVSEPQVRCPRVRQDMEDVARYEDGRSRLHGPRFGADLHAAGPYAAQVDTARGYDGAPPRLHGPRFGADLHRAGPFEDEVDLGRPVAVPAQRLAGWHPADAHGERLAAGDVPADEGPPVNQALPRDLFFRPRFPLASAFLDDDRFTAHLPTSLLGDLRALIPHSRANKHLRDNFLEPPQCAVRRITLPRTPPPKGTRTELG